jgi:predicted DCC family thiol-disulfide oxidoreductase YuxK
VIFFDGVCGMCNRFVDIVMKADRRGVFRFAPLQGETARRLLPPLPPDPRDWSLLYLDERGLHDQSDASLEVYRRLGGAWKILALARFVPRAIRTPVYRRIARNRYRWFGRREACRVPTEADRARFLP